MTLSNRELKEMRAGVEGLYPDVCNLLTLTSTSDGQGGMTEVWGTATRNSPCRVDQMIGSERLTDGSLRSFASLELALPYDVEITEAYRVEHGGFTYEVTDANKDQSWQIEKAVLLERVS
jgi:head-tail adaptor